MTADQYVALFRLLTNRLKTIGSVSCYALSRGSFSLIARSALSDVLRASDVLS